MKRENVGVLILNRALRALRGEWQSLCCSRLQEKRLGNFSPFLHTYARARTHTHPNPHKHLFTKAHLASMQMQAPWLKAWHKMVPAGFATIG